MLNPADFETIIIPDEFGSDEDGNTTYSMDSVIEQVINLSDTANIEWRYGASKMVFLLDSTVIKLPFEGYETFLYDYETEEYYDEPTFEYYDNHDYCALEANIYAEAEECGVSQFFASTTIGGYTLNNKPFYISEKVNEYYAINRELDKPSPASSKKALEIRENNYCGGLDATWIARAIDWYGEREVDNLLAFIDMMNINDLSYTNVGFRADGSPVLMDYSGFWS